MSEFVFVELCPRKRLITGKEAEKLEAKDWKQKNRDCQKNPLKR